jgi:hypothetical protein
MKTEDYFKKIIDKNLIDGSWLFLGIDEEAKFNFVLNLAEKISDISNIFIISSLNKISEDIPSRFQVWEPSIESVRQAIHFLSLTTPSKKVFIVNSAEDLENAAQNALLKTVEEPNNNSVIFFISKNESRILPTLCSRMKTINLPVFDRKKYFQKRIMKESENYFSDSKDHSLYFKKVLALDDDEKMRFMENVVVLLRDRMLDSIGVSDLKIFGLQSKNNGSEIRESLKIFSRLEDYNVNFRLQLENLVFKISR